jgi:tetratricopeptide (TPR) repeat protein
VERDLPGAEEYYGRALLACPGDADLLSLYGRVLWEADQDKDRADGYFQRAVQAAPDDWYALARAHAGRAISYRSWFFYSVCDRPNLTRDV